VAGQFDMNKLMQQAQQMQAQMQQAQEELAKEIVEASAGGGMVTVKATGAGEIWVTHGQEDALVHWCKARGLAARPLDLVGYGDEEESEVVAADEAEA